MKDFCFGWVDPLAVLFFSLQIHEEEEKVGRVSLSMKDCGAASRAAKSQLRLLFWKTWGIFSLQSANISALLSFFAFFSILFLFVASLLKDNGYWVVRCRLREIPADVFCARFKDFL